MPGVHITSISNEQQAIELINTGLQLRPTAPQSLNPTSSRSHLIITYYLKKRISADSQAVISKLTFVDLAGSERVGTSDSKGLRLDEAKSINSSLSSLAEAICHLKHHNETFLFRNSKLTKVLQQSLMGQSYICILGMVRKSPLYISETLATLKFVLKCRQIRISDPQQCYYNDIYPDVQAAQDMIGTQELTQRDNQPEEQYNQQEFTEFSVFLGKCLISLSRLIKKINIDLAQKAQNSQEFLIEEQEGTNRLNLRLLQNGV